MNVSGFRVKEVYGASGHVRTSGIVGIGDRALSGFSRLRVLTRNFRKIILGKCLRREGQELGIFARIIGKCRGGYRDKTVEVIGRELGSCRRLSLTLETEVQAARALQLARQHEIRVGEAGMGKAAPRCSPAHVLPEEWSELLKVPSNRTPDALLGPEILLSSLRPRGPRAPTSAAQDDELLGGGEGTERCAAHVHASGPGHCVQHARPRSGNAEPQP